MKGYDPTKTDIAALMLDYLFDISRTNSTIKIDQASKSIKKWIAKSATTSAIFQKLKSINLKPNIRIKNKCMFQGESYFPLEIKNKPNSTFPSYIKQNQIVICLDEMRTQIELKQSLDRQLKLMYLLELKKQQIPQNQNAKDQELQSQNYLMRSFYQSCYDGYRNYMVSETVTKQMALICAKYRFYRQSKKRLPVDRKYRYVTRIADELFG